MKKILSIALAVCLALSLSISVFASSVTLPPPSNNDYSDSPLVSKYTYGATDATGKRVQVTVDVLNNNSDIGKEISDCDPVGVYALSVGAGVSDDTVVTFDVYAPGASNGDTVLVRDAWDILEGANLVVNGDRARFSATAGTVRKWTYFAIVKNTDSVNVNVPQEAPGTTDDPEQNPGDINVGDGDEEEKKDENPKTGVVLALVPMMVAAAAIVVSKKR